MNSICTGRECRGKYYVTSTQGVPGHHEEFEKGTFLGFGVSYEEFEGGPGHYTTAIVELKDGKVIETIPQDIQFINSKRIIKPKKPLADDVKASGMADDEIPSEDKKEPQRDKQRAKSSTQKKPGRRQIDHRKIRALKNAGWSNKDIAGEMHMTPGAVSVSLSTHKELIEELKKI